MSLDVAFISLGIGGTISLLAAALALGIRHGIDWDHIAAITDITSTAAAVDEPAPTILTGEPGLLFTDESHHARVALASATLQPAAATAAIAVTAPHSHAHTLPQSGGRSDSDSRLVRIVSFVRRQRWALFLGTVYALGHGSMVFALGLLALLVSEILPKWVDPIMERTVGVTLILLAVYLFYSVAQFFRSGQEFRIRSRWMLVFAGVRNLFEWLRARVLGRPPAHVHEAQQYGVKTAYAVGLIHGIGAETGTQVLVVATAVGASNRAIGTAALVAFVIGVLISNSVMTVVSTTGFVSSQRRQKIYVTAGLIAAIFSLVVGLFFLFAQSGVLPNLGNYFRWIGGGN
ncbi:MAG: hypothetical protein IVW36_06650 [Dehalococcoidia bacterium]|nr:hypothetical protein [Dehalococcoidia bacterium]